MTEEVKLFKYSHNPERERRPTRAKIVNLVEFSGGVNRMQMVVAMIKQLFVGSDGNNLEIESKRPVSFVRRDLRSELSLDYGYLWRELKKVGLTVVDWIRTDGNYYYLPNLVADGSRIYGRSAATIGIIDTTVDAYEHLFYQPSQLDKVFIALMTKHFAQVYNDAMNLAAMATDKGVLLPEDTFAIYIRPDESWQLILLDLELALINKSGDKLGEVNNYLVKDVLNELAATALILQERIDRNS